MEFKFFFLLQNFYSNGKCLQMPKIINRHKAQLSQLNQKCGPVVQYRARHSIQADIVMVQVRDDRNLEKWQSRCKGARRQIFWRQTWEELAIMESEGDGGILMTQVSSLVESEYTKGQVQFWTRVEFLSRDIPQEVL